jgi:2-polyprenyl-3-methyl-5-hydroxy-6-metoxy-1,4-benzoquinol methylase
MDMVHHDTVHDAFPLPDLGPDTYARWRASNIGAITEQLERRLVLAGIGDVRGTRILEIGCGDGDLSVTLARRGALVTAIDASPEMIDAARARAVREQVAICFDVAEARKLPFPAGQFDIVVAVTVLCFVSDAAPVFQEIARVLRPGGRLVDAELGKYSSWAAGRRIRAWLGSALWRRGRFRTPEELRRLARGAGLVPGAVRGAIYYPKCDLAARRLAPFDAVLGRWTTFGAAFLSLEAAKPTATP